MAAWSEISVNELQQWRDDGVDHLLIDVREDWELAIARLDPCRHIPMASIPEQVAVLRDTGLPLVALCHAGVRSARVASYLSDQGCTQVYSVAGGIDAWSQLIDGQVERY